MPQPTEERRQTLAATLPYNLYSESETGLSLVPTGYRPTAVELCRRDRDALQADE